MHTPASLTISSTVPLNNGVALPVLGFGTWRLQGAQARMATETAIRTGYRLIDTASAYDNEVEVGEAIRRAGIPRGALFITSKLWSHEHGHDEAKEACHGSLERLGLEQLDLYLIHWPSGGRNVETWQGMIELLREGRTRAIGVSNFSMEEIAPLIEATGIVPSVDQVEFNPYNHDDHLLTACAGAGIRVEAYSPLNGMNLQDPRVTELARRHRRSPAQIVLRWCLQKGTVVLTKSSHAERIAENSRIFDFALTPEEMTRMDRLE
jgi:diketogulonate reductase-like aldo/keto reductase